MTEGSWLSSTHKSNSTTLESSRALTSIHICIIGVYYLVKALSKNYAFSSLYSKLVRVARQTFVNSSSQKIASSFIDLTFKHTHN